MFKGIKKKLTSRSNGKNRLGIGREDSPSRESLDKGTSKPISPRQVHPSDNVPPAPYARRSLEKSRTAPTKMLPGMSYAMYDENMKTQVYSNQQRHTMQGAAYPTAPNICVTGGKIEFIQSAGSPGSSETSAACPSPCLSPQRSRLPPPSFSSDQLQKPKIGSPSVSSKYSTSRTPFSFYSSSEFTPSPTPSTSSRRSLRRKERMERRKADINGHKTASLNPRRGSSQSNSDSVRVSKSSTMPSQLETEQEILKLKEENRSVKHQLAIIQREYAKLESKAQNLQIVNRETENLVVENDIYKNKLKEFEETVERCNALEYANAQLQTEAQVQRLQYEKCLDKVASQVVQAIIVQKNQQEQCDKLTKEVNTLQKQNAKLCSLLAAKANSLSPSHVGSKASYFLSQNLHEMQSHSLPSTLRNNKTIFHKTKRKSRNPCLESESEADASFSSQQNSESPFSEDSLEATKSPLGSSQTPPKSKEEAGCWYDIIKNLHLGDALPSIDNGASHESSNNPDQSSGSESGEFSHFVLTSEKSDTSTSNHNSGLSHPLVYSQSSNNQELIVNYSLVPEVSTASIMPSTIVPAPKKVQTDGGTEVATKDEGYSTMSSDVQTESKEPLLLAIPTLFEEKGKCLDTAEQEETEESCETSDVTALKSNSDQSVEFVDGLRVVYDVDETDSDVFVVPLSNKHPRHSCDLQSKLNFTSMNRSLSESCLTNSEKVDTKKAPKTMPYSSVREQNKVTLQLDSVNSPLKKRKARREQKSVEDSSESDVQIKAKNPSPSYSHAEMEDWSLDLSGEDLTNAELDPSTYGSTQDNASTDPPNDNIELEEDNNECLWNGASYFKSENDFDWQYEKNKSWDVKLRQCNPRSMNSPKSGCSDQPAMWSSSEQLSCCSDIASKCSTDIENFCEQLCNLPELKRISVSDNDNVPDVNLTKLPDLDEAEDVAVDTVFTRDFYKLVKFESTKSLAASSNSLAVSEGPLKSDVNDTGLASVLGFIAEQQQYCRQREKLDETSLTLPTNLRSTSSSLCAKNNALNSLNSVQAASLRNNNIMRNQTTISNSAYQTQPDGPLKPTRSTSLNLGYRRFDSLASPKTVCEPVPPSRSTSRVTLPRHSYHANESSGMVPLIESSSDLSDCEPLPPIPPHRSGIPPAPQRISSLHRVFNNCDSPPVPKRVTSRALPLVPSTANPVHTPPRTTSLNEKRPKSLLRDDSEKTHKSPKNRSSCGEISPMCRSSAALLIQLQKMAQEEEDSKDVYVSPVDATPCEETALETGWVRVQPPDMQNPEARANLLDSMMPSSDTTSTETEEDATSKSQHVQLLKAAQRNRRKKKASRHNTDFRRTSPTRNQCDIGTGDEQNALNSFSFLDNMSSDDSRRGSRRKRSLSRPIRSQGQSKDLSDLRSSGPCEEFECPYPKLRPQPFPLETPSVPIQRSRPGSIHGKISLFQKTPEKETILSKPKIPTTSIVGKIRESFERPSSIHLDESSSSKQNIGLEKCNVKAVIEQFNKKPDPIVHPSPKSSRKASKINATLPPKGETPKKSGFFKSSKNFFNRKSGKNTPGKLSLSDSCAETFSPLVSDEDVFMH